MLASKQRIAYMADPAIPAVLAPDAGVRRFLRFEIPEIWMRFLLALLGLILAFAAAIFSTVARESGSLWATVILASVALVLAVVVGLTTVPYLARRVAGSRVRDAFNYDVTGVGIIYVVSVLLIGIAALNTGNNLLYVIVAAMLAAILVSGVASAIVLRELELDIHLPEQVFAGRPTLGKMMVRNRRRWLPSFSISVVPLKQKASKQWKWVPTTFGFPPGQPPAKQWVILPDRQLRRIAGAHPLRLVFLPSRHIFPTFPRPRKSRRNWNSASPAADAISRTALVWRHAFPLPSSPRRGAWLWPARYWCTRRWNETDEFFDVLPLITGEFETFARGRGDDLYLIREYMPEDSARHVDWKATAKSGLLYGREFSREDDHGLHLFSTILLRGRFPSRLTKMR